MLKSKIFYLLILSLVCLFPTLALAQRQTLLFDFGASTMSVKENGWNNLTETVGCFKGRQLSNLINTNNVKTGIGLEITSPFNGANVNGTTESEYFHVDATKDSLYGMYDGHPSFKLIGLDPKYAYDITFYASRCNVHDVREASYTVRGKAQTDRGEAPMVLTFDPANNRDDFVTAVGVVPDAKNEITISIDSTENNNNAHHFTYLGVMKVEEVKLESGDGQSYRPPHQIQSIQTKFPVRSLKILPLPKVIHPMTLPVMYS